MEHGFMFPEATCTFPDSDPQNRLDPNGFPRQALPELSTEDDPWVSGVMGSEVWAGNA